MNIKIYLSLFPYISQSNLSEAQAPVHQFANILTNTNEIITKILNMKNGIPPNLK